MLLKLLKSIVTTDGYILFFAAFTVLFLVMCRQKARYIEKYVWDWEHSGELTLNRYVHSELSMWYSLFTAMISIFPLLGMFGTVRGLLAMDMTGGDMGLMKTNFFGALTSTAWGILFSIGFKLVHALVRDYIETQIERSEEMSRQTGDLPGQKVRR